MNNTPVYRASSTSAGGSVPNNHPDDDVPNLPPAYSSTISTSMNAHSQLARKTHAGLPNLSYELYHPPTFTLSSDSTLISSHSKILSSDPAQLCEMIKSLASVPPKPIVQIVGISETGTDFKIKVNLMSLLVRTEEKGAMNYIKMIGHEEEGFRGTTQKTLKPRQGGIEEWCKAFCEDKSAIKQ